MWTRQVIQDLWEHLVELEGKKQEGRCTTIALSFETGKKSREATTLSADVSRKAGQSDRVIGVCLAVVVGTLEEEEKGVQN